MKKRNLVIFISVILLIFAYPTAFCAEGDIIDTCDDFSKVYEKSDGWTVKSNNSDKLGGDTGRFQRSSGTAGSSAPEYQYLTYKISNMERISVLFYYTNRAYIDAVKFKISEDNENFIELDFSIESYNETSGAWSGSYLKAKAVSEKYQYLKIELYKSAPLVTGCGFGEINIYTRSDEYIDSLHISNSFVDSDYPWRISASSSVVNHGSVTVSKNGDSDVLYGNDSGAELIYSVKGGKEFLLTAYLPCDVLAEEIFSVEYSSDNQIWTVADTNIVEYIIYENVSGEMFRACIIKSAVPDLCSFAKIKWLSGHWSYMLGEVEQRNPIDLGNFFDDLTDFKKIATSGLYIKKYINTNVDDALDNTFVQRTRYCSGQNSFDASSALVKKYGEYTPKQYITYDILPTQKNDVNVQTYYTREAAAVQQPFKFMYKTERGEWVNISAERNINGKLVTYYLDVPVGAASFKIEWPSEGEVEEAQICNVKVCPSENMKAKIQKLAYYVDGKRVYSTPESYGSIVGVTGAIYNAAETALLNPNIYAALYDNDGNLAAVNSTAMPKSLWPGEESNFNIEIQNPMGMGKKLKIFYWEEEKPVCAYSEDVIYNSSEFERSGILIDDFKDFSKMYYYNQSFKIEEQSNNNSRFQGSPQIFIRTYPLRQSFKYNIYNAKSLTINAYLFRKEGNIRVYAGGYDGRYREVHVETSDLTYTANSWYAVTYTVSEFPEGTNYIQVEIEPGGISYTPALTRAEITY